jgi:SAM-dependent MidA family methyltransferase
MRVELPEPSPEERAHSDRVAALIRAEIAAAGGALDFSRYMELALYAPGLGYYSAGKTKFGAAGDFVTAPELGFLFARCVARALVPTLQATTGDVLELGPGSGALAAELLLELERLGALPLHYRLLERSADLRARQREILQERCPHLLPRCEWLDAPPHAPWSGALIANEVLDALPVRVFALRDDQLFARAVACDAQGAFVWRDESADARLRSDVRRTLGERIHTLPQPYVSEICPLLAPWFAEVTRSLESGIALFIDYGYTRDEYYAPQRTLGTLRCHYRHRAHDDPLILPGIQDITAWVDFDALGEAALASGWRVNWLSSQSRFLLEHGLSGAFDAAFAAATEAGRYRLAQEAKNLMLPDQMGERFRAMQLLR